MTVLSVKWKKVEEPLLIQLRKRSVLNRYRNKCNWISLSELVLPSTENSETISRLKSRPHPCAPPPAFWWVQDEHYSWKLPPELGEHSGCTTASNQCAQCDTTVLLPTASHSLCHPVKQGHCCWARTTNQGNSHPCCQADRGSRTCKAEARARRVWTHSEGKTKDQAHGLALLKTSAAI